MSPETTSTTGPGQASLVASNGEPEIELSVVMPCLNEAETLATCIRKAQDALAGHGINGEIIVADNGSTDGSQEIATSLGARVVPVASRGYGNALRGGIAAARGRFVLMGDADDSYDFAAIPQFVEKLREGYDLVQGCRLERGGGRVLPGAMPTLHRRWGNPMFSAIARSWFRAPISDVYCGMRAFTKRHYDSLGQRCTGMEFAIEMIVKSSLHPARIAEVPVTLHPDGRTTHAPHLRTFRDGWRTLRLFLVYSPRWLFLAPGIMLTAVAALGYALALPGISALGVTFDAHTLLFASLAMICGYQAILFGVLTKIFAVNAGLTPPDRRIERLSRKLTLERVLTIAGVAILAGLVLLGLAVGEWSSRDFGHLNYADTMRLVIPGVTLTALGFQSVLAAFYISVLAIGRR